MLDFMSVLSRYYFVFLILYFVVVAARYIVKEKGDGAAVPLGQRAVTILFVMFAFPILALSDDMLSVNLETLIFGGLVLVFVVLGSVLKRKIYKNICPLITNTMFFLLALGFVALYRLAPDLAARQLLFAAMGVGASLLIPLIFRIFRQFERLEKLYLTLCVALVGVIVIADGIGRLFNIPIVSVDAFGAVRWISIAGMSFQPSAFAKPLFVIYLACAFRTKPGAGKLVFVGTTSAAIIGLLVLQRDLGSALMYFAVFMVILYAATGSKILLATGLGAVSVASVAAYQIFPHLRIRVAAWHNPWADISGQGFQIAQSLFAIGTWGPFGIGLGRGLPGRIPVVERDVIFSAISEEFGWLFGLLLIAVYAMFFLRGALMANRAKRPLHALMTLGFAALLAFQAFVSIGGNIKLIPMTGITLPFVSYGGSSVFVSILMVGVLNWLYGQNGRQDAVPTKEEA
ncbi:MAG: FtsW/RodA/SpoVE family cell cycle protein [Defluviitaleaceae bacterium]|nr:FtsW/RodA/SpoVE family cell cycle protein [Defluviitaleaceae bacterium]